MSSQTNPLKKGLTLDQKINLWKHYNDHINSIESRLTTAVTLVSIAFTVLTTTMGKINIIYVVPALCVVFLYYLSYQQRIVEILRGFLLYIESTLESETGFRGILWNNYGVSKNYNVSFFRTQILSGYFFAIIIAFPLGYSFYKMFFNKENIFFIILYMIISLFFCISFALDLYDNRFIAEIIKQALINGDIDAKPKLNRKALKKLIKNKK